MTNSVPDDETELRDHERKVIASMIGSFLKDRRRKFGKSIEDLSVLVNIKTHEWAAVEAGQVIPNHARLVAMAQAVGATPEEAEQMSRQWNVVRK